MSKFKGLWDDDDDDLVVLSSTAVSASGVESNYKELYEQEHRRREELEQLVVMLKEELKNLRQRLRNEGEEKQVSMHVCESDTTGVSQSSSTEILTDWATGISQSSSTEILTDWDKLALEEKERKQKFRRQKQMSGSNRGKLMSRRTQQSNTSNPVQSSIAAPTTTNASEDIVQKVSSVNIEENNSKQSTSWSSDSSNFDSSSENSDSDSGSSSDDSGFDDSRDNVNANNNVAAVNHRYIGLTPAELDQVIDKEIVEWARSNTFISMLQNIKQVYSGRLVLPSHAIDEAACRKAYLNIIRQIHPDKVNKADVESYVKIQSLKLSTCLSDAYNSYKQK